MRLATYELCACADPPFVPWATMAQRLTSAGLLPLNPGPNPSPTPTPNSNPPTGTPYHPERCLADGDVTVAISPKVGAAQWTR